MKTFHFTYEKTNLENEYKGLAEKEIRENKQRDIIYYVIIALEIIACIAWPVIDPDMDIIMHCFVFLTIILFTLFLKFEGDYSLPMTKYQDILDFYNLSLSNKVKTVKQINKKLVYKYSYNGVIKESEVPIKEVEIRDDIDEDRIFFCESGVIYQKCWK